MDNKKNIINVVLFIILILASDAIAYEPPNTSVKDAILNGNVAFIGRVVKIEEVDDTDFWSTAIADVEIIQVFYGLHSNAGESVKVQFKSRLYSAYPYPGFELSLLISDVVLFVFNAPQVSENSSFYFNSYWKNPKYPDRKIDLAFKAGDSPSDRFNLNKKEHSFYSAYTSSMRAIVNIKNLFKWASERSAMINQKDDAVVESQ